MEHYFPVAPALHPIGPAGVWQSATNGEADKVPLSPFIVSSVTVRCSPLTGPSCALPETINTCSLCCAPLVNKQKKHFFEILLQYYTRYLVPKYLIQTASGKAAS